MFIQINTPKMYGAFHITFIILITISCIFVSKRCKNISENKNIFIFKLASYLLIIVEIYKQIVLSFEKGYFDYNWSIFPFQLSSLPIYIFPLVVILKSERIRNSLYCFIVYYLLFGGIAVILYPKNVLGRFLGVNIQTMVFHGTMIVIGVYLITTHRIKTSLKYFLYATLIFFIFMVGALFLNIIVFNFINIDNDIFNMFFISPYFECNIPILMYVQKYNPYFIFLAVYFACYVIIAFTIRLINIIIYNKLFTTKELL